MPLGDSGIAGEQCRLGCARRLPQEGGASSAQRDGTDLLNFLDVTVLVIGGDGLGGLGVLIVPEQGRDLQQSTGQCGGMAGTVLPWLPVGAGTESLPCTAPLDLWGVLEPWEPISLGAGQWGFDSG